MFILWVFFSMHEVSHFDIYSWTDKFHLTANFGIFWSRPGLEPVTSWLRSQHSTIILGSSPLKGYSSLTTWCFCNPRDTCLVRIECTSHDSTSSSPVRADSHISATLVARGFTFCWFVSALWTIFILWVFFSMHKVSHFDIHSWTDKLHLTANLGI